MNKEQELLKESLRTLLRAFHQQQDTVKGQLIFQEALRSVPMDTLRHFNDSTELTVELTQLRKNEITPSERENKDLTNRIFDRIVTCVSGIKDLPGLDEILATADIPPLQDRSGMSDVKMGKSAAEEKRSTPSHQSSLTDKTQGPGDPRTSKKDDDTTK